MGDGMSGYEHRNKETVASKDVGGMIKTFSEDDPMFQKEYPAVPEAEVLTDSEGEGENIVTENMKDDAPVEVPDVAPEDIKYLKNEDNGRVFEVTPEIIGQRHLVPCTKEGKTFKDTRVSFNGMR
jgi:hypothetical protein